MVGMNDTHVWMNLRHLGQTPPHPNVHNPLALMLGSATCLCAWLGEGPKGSCNPDNRSQLSSQGRRERGLSQPSIEGHLVLYP